MIRIVSLPVDGPTRSRRLAVVVASALLETDGEQSSARQTSREADEHADDQAKRTASGRTKCGTLHVNPLPKGQANASMSALAHL